MEYRLVLCRRVVELLVKRRLRWRYLHLVLGLKLKLLVIFLDHVWIDLRGKNG